MLPSLETNLSKWESSGALARGVRSDVSDGSASSMFPAAGASENALSSLGSASVVVVGPPTGGAKIGEQSASPRHPCLSRIPGRSHHHPLEATLPPERSTSLEVSMSTHEVAGLAALYSLPAAPSPCDDLVLEQLLTSANGALRPKRNLPRQRVSRPPSRPGGGSGGETQQNAYHVTTAADLSSRPGEEEDCLSSSLTSKPLPPSPLPPGAELPADALWAPMWPPDRQPRDALPFAALPREGLRLGSRRSPRAATASREGRGKPEAGDATGRRDAGELSEHAVSSEELSGSFWERSVQRILGEAASALRRYPLESRTAAAEASNSPGLPPQARSSAAAWSEESKLLSLRALSRNAADPRVPEATSELVQAVAEGVLRSGRGAGGTGEGRGAISASPLRGLDTQPQRGRRDGPPGGAASVDEVAECLERLYEKNAENTARLRLALMLSRGGYVHPSECSSRAQLDCDEEAKDGLETAVAAEKRGRADLPGELCCAPAAECAAGRGLGENDWEAASGLAAGGSAEGARALADGRRIRALLAASAAGSAMDGKRRRRGSFGEEVGRGGKLLCTEKDDDAGLAVSSRVGCTRADDLLSSLASRVTHPRAFDASCPPPEALRSAGAAGDGCAPLPGTVVGNALQADLPSLCFLARGETGFQAARPQPRGYPLGEDEALRQTVARRELDMGQFSSSVVRSFPFPLSRQVVGDRHATFAPAQSEELDEMKTRSSGVATPESDFFVMKSGRLPVGSEVRGTADRHAETQGGRRFGKFAAGPGVPDCQEGGVGRQPAPVVDGRSGGPQAGDEAEDRNLPECWTVGQKDHFTEKYKWLFISGGMLGCLYCRAMKDRGLRARKRGMKIVSHWADGAVKPSGASRVTNMRSLRKKICRHQDSRTHKEAAELLGEGSLEEAFGGAGRKVHDAARLATLRAGAASPAAMGGNTGMNDWERQLHFLEPRPRGEAPGDGFPPRMGGGPPVGGPVPAVPEHARTGGGRGDDRETGGHVGFACGQPRREPAADSEPEEDSDDESVDSGRRGECSGGADANGRAEVDLRKTHAAVFRAIDGG
ncbi:hypothetical protein BESB_071650 [Besnoitia besnoiti]|uniref:Uncharacterized protein n=1 Tax=Besnoitia besnoiti TaxID=94643 RepID=A0A2A9MEB7_BESBE|nr:uncharacterized protein BESB_071650 [Besnoitia besnoiti]PFH34013.1 hypothetical protein BESB_071650 [Besnoitia besnoiti]